MAYKPPSVLPPVNRSGGKPANTGGKRYGGKGRHGRGGAKGRPRLTPNTPI